VVNANWSEEVSSFWRPNAANMSAMLGWSTAPVQYKYNHTVEWEYHIDGPLGRNKIFYDTILHYFFRVPCRTPLFPSPCCCPLDQTSAPSGFASIQIASGSTASFPAKTTQSLWARDSDILVGLDASYCHFFAPLAPARDESRNISAIHQY
jgi:hypothetical protein